MSSHATHTTSIGSISSGTLITEALVEAFADELTRIGLGLVPSVVEAHAALTLIDAGWDDIAEDDRLSELVDALAGLLHDEAPPYCYFGAHEGDGTDFGFWPSMDAIEELPRIDDPSEAGNFDEDHVYINDHGNVTVYNSDGEVLLEAPALRANY